MIMLPKALSFAILRIEIQPKEMSLNDIIVRLTAIRSIYDEPVPFDEAVRIVEEEEMLEDELLRQICLESGVLMAPASTARH